MTTSLDRTLAALAEPTRRGVIDLLRVRPRAAGELASEFAMSAAAMSRHLRVLRLRGLVEEKHSDRRDARVRVYRLRRQPFVQLSNWAAGLESFWSGQLESFKEHAEKRGGKG
jgi:DNA-binding transcriptional ArsR family regulator